MGTQAASATLRRFSSTTFSIPSLARWWWQSHRLHKAKDLIQFLLGRFLQRQLGEHAKGHLLAVIHFPWV